MYAIEFPSFVSDLLADGDEVDAPGTSISSRIPNIVPSSPSGFWIDSYSDKWVAGTRIERLHAKRKMEIYGRLYLKVNESAEVTSNIRIFYDGQREPDKMEMVVKIDCSVIEEPWETIKCMINR